MTDHLYDASTPERTARVDHRPPVHWWRPGTDPSGHARRTACCRMARIDLPRGHGTTTDWSLVTCPEWLDWQASHR